MLSRVAHVLLVTTSLSPISLIYGVSRVVDDARVAATFISLALVSAALCVCVVSYAARHGEIEPVSVTKSKSVDKDALGFVIAYALPVVVPGTSNKPQNVLALVAFSIIAFLVLFQLQIAQVNPVLALLRYHFYEVSPPSGETALLITRGPGTPGPTRVVKLSASVWLEQPT